MKNLLLMFLSFLIVVENQSLASVLYEDKVFLEVNRKKPGPHKKKSNTLNVIDKNIPGDFSRILSKKVYLKNNYTKDKNTGETLLTTRVVYWLDKKIKSEGLAKLTHPTVIKEMLGAKRVVPIPLFLMHNSEFSQKQYFVLVKEKILFKKIKMTFKVDVSVNSFDKVSGNNPKDNWSIRNLPGVRNDDIIMEAHQFDFSQIMGQQAFNKSLGRTWFIHYKDKTLVLLLQETAIKTDFLKGFGVQSFMESSIEKRIINSYRYMQKEI